MDTLQQHILTSGPVVFPLLFCSVMVLALIAERLIVTMRYPSLHSERRKGEFLAKQLPSTKSSSGLLAGLNLLSEHNAQNKVLRDEVLAIWLQNERENLLAHTRWLTLLGSLAPLLGLLGTVLGIIAMFQNIAHEPGPVTPGLLADGMWEAMVTTALGMLIAIPALTASHGFSIWGDHRIAAMTQVLNECSLALELSAANASRKIELRKVITPNVFSQTSGEQEGQLA